MSVIQSEVVINPGNLQQQGPSFESQNSRDVFV